MKANSKRKVFGDAVDLLMGDMEEVTMPRGVQMVPVKNIQAFHDHPFHLYEGERLHCAGYPTEEALVIFHKHRFKDGYHQHGHARSLRQAIKSIVKHDDYQLNVRKCV